jgi:hypothetical protein
MTPDEEQALFDECVNGETEDTGYDCNESDGE